MTSNELEMFTFKAPENVVKCNVVLSFKKKQKHEIFMTKYAT